MISADFIPPRSDIAGLTHLQKCGKSRFYIKHKRFCDSLGRRHSVAVVCSGLSAVKTLPGFRFEHTEKQNQCSLQRASQHENA